MKSTPEKLVQDFYRVCVMSSLEIQNNDSFKVLVSSKIMKPLPQLQRIYPMESINSSRDESWTIKYNFLISNYLLLLLLHPLLNNLICIPSIVLPPIPLLTQ